MRGELNGLKTLILNENPSARYVHCFAHQLQLVVVAVAEGNQFVGAFFEYMSMITNIVGASCKRKDILRQKQHENMVALLEHGEISTGRGLHQESSLARPGDTRWGSHYKIIIRLLSMWSSVGEVLVKIYEDGTERKGRSKVVGLIDKMENYEFVFIAHLMKMVLGLTNSLSHFLQQKDQNIVEAMSLVSNVKRRWQILRNNRWDELLEDVSSFCSENNIITPNMEDIIASRIRNRHAGNVPYIHHFRVEIFSQVIDHLGQEMTNQFSEASTELLMCISYLDPKNSFSNFSASRILRSKVVGLIDKVENYEFVFIAHLMKIVLGITNSLSQFLKQKDQNIVEAMSLVSNIKRPLQTLRDNGWDELLEDVSSFAQKIILSLLIWKILFLAAFVIDVLEM